MSFCLSNKGFLHYCGNTATFIVIWILQFCCLVTLASVVVFEFIPGATAGFPLTAKGAFYVDANLADDTVVNANKTLVNI